MENKLTVESLRENPPKISNILVQKKHNLGLNTPSNRTLDSSIHKMTQYKFCLRVRFSTYCKNRSDANVGDEYACGLCRRLYFLKVWGNLTSQAVHRGFEYGKSRHNELNVRSYQEKITDSVQSHRAQLTLPKTLNFTPTLAGQLFLHVTIQQYYSPKKMCVIILSQKL